MFLISHRLVDIMLLMVGEDLDEPIQKELKLIKMDLYGQLR
jgi:hypothetical protein